LSDQLEDSESPIFEDINYSDGVLNIEMRDQRFYVLNKQTPNIQIWLSSPITGPSRFDYGGNGKWVRRHHGDDILEMLEGEFNNNFARSEGEKVQLHYE